MRAMTTQEKQAPKINRLLITSWQVSDNDNYYTAVNRGACVISGVYTQVCLRWMSWPAIVCCFRWRCCKRISGNLDYKHSLIFHRDCRASETRERAWKSPPGRKVTCFISAFYLKDSRVKFWVKGSSLLFLDAVATVDVLTASNNFIETQTVHFA